MFRVLDIKHSLTPKTLKFKKEHWENKLVEYRQDAENLYGYDWDYPEESIDFIFFIDTYVKVKKSYISIGMWYDNW